MHNAKVVLRRQLRQFKILCLQQRNIHSQLATKQYSSHMYFYKWMLELQNVEKFALRMVIKRWDTGYQELLDMAALPSLETSCMLYKIVHNLCYFPSNIITPRPNVSKRTDRQLLLYQPFARTNAYMYVLLCPSHCQYLVLTT